MGVKVEIALDDRDVGDGFEVHTEGFDSRVVCSWGVVDADEGGFAFALVACNIDSEDVRIGDQKRVHKDFVIVGDSLVDIDYYLGSREVLVLVDTFPSVMDDGANDIVA